MQNQSSDFPNQPNAGQAPNYNQPSSYDQPFGYGQPPMPPGHQPPTYGQPFGYGQPPSYGQAPSYSAQPLYQPIANPRQNYEAQMNEARSKQNLGLGIVGGLLGALLGAVIWIVVAFVTNYELGLIAILVGFLAGFGVRQLGKGVDPVFGVMGAVLALVGSLVGSIGATYFIIVKEGSVELANRLFLEVWQSDLKPLNFAFAALAVVFGYIAAMQNAPKKPKV